MPARVVESAVDGLKTNARSLANPSPLTSPLTTGVNGVPEATRAVVFTENNVPTRVANENVTWWRTSNEPRVRCTSSGFPPVVPPKPRDCFVGCPAARTPLATA